MLTTDHASHPAVRVLNRAWAADQAAIHALVCNHVPCNQALADDPTIVVDPNHFMPGRATLGAIGLLNGVLAEAGMPLVALKWSDERDAEGRATLLGFCEYQPPTG